MNFFVLLENHVNTEGVEFCARKDVFRQKSDFFEFCSIQGVKISNRYDLFPSGKKIFVTSYL